MKGRKFSSLPNTWRKSKPRARAMRKKPTSTEELLWEKLRNRQLGGLKFRRQHSVGPFIVDFLCPEKNLVIEIDGDIHQFTKVEDAYRQECLQNMGLVVLRFPNKEVEISLPYVLEKISATVHSEPER